MTAADQFVNAIRNGEPRALQAIHRLLEDMRHVDDITELELALLRNLANGDSTTEIARGMGVSFSTIKKREAAVRAKLGALNRPHAVAIAIREGMIQ